MYRWFLWAGIAFGAIGGLIAGITSTIVVLNNQYNYYVDNVETALILTGGSMAAGIIGGLLGGLVNYAYKHITSGPQQQENKIKIIDLIDDGQRNTGRISNNDLSISNERITILGRISPSKIK